MNNAKIRQYLRNGHLIASGILGMYLYSPWGSDPTFDFTVKFVIFPAMAVSGIWMWQQGRINRFLKRDSKKS